MKRFRSIYLLLLAGSVIFPAGKVLGQNSPTPAVFHLFPAKNGKRNLAPGTRRTKFRLDFGAIAKQYYNADPHYTSNTTGNGAYTLGLRMEIPAMRNSSVLIGVEFLKQSFTFDSYFFAPGYSFLYDGNLIYNHAISLDEVHVPFEYKFCFSQENKNIKTFYGVIGWVYRISVYDNSLVTNIQSGKFVWEGQNDIAPIYSLFFNPGSTILEICFGYQHNTLRNGNAWFFEIAYKYGFSPLLYTGNNMGSNSVEFTLNTLAFKLGLKL